MERRVAPLGPSAVCNNPPTPGRAAVSGFSYTGGDRVGLLGEIAFAIPAFARIGYPNHSLGVIPAYPRPLAAHSHTVSHPRPAGRLMSTSIERFTTNCPSCDAGVAVKAALVGKKIECPKCKFRFVVSAPAGADADTPAPKPAKGGAKAAKGDDAKADPKGSKGKDKSAKKGKEKEKKGGGNGKVIVGAIVGVIALVGLAVGAIMIFGKLNGDSAKGTPTQQNQNRGDSGGGRPRIGPAPEEPGGNPMTPGGDKDPMNGDKEPMKGTEPDPTTPKPETPDPMTPAAGGGNTATTPKPITPFRPTGVEITNLLPNDTTAVFHARLDDLDKNARTLRNVVFDKVTTDLFERSMNFKADHIVEVVQGEVGIARDPFVVLRTKSTLDDTMFAKPKMDTTPPETIHGRQYRVVNRNAFLSAAEKSLGVVSVLAPLLGLELPADDAPAGKPIKYAICMYDTNTLVITEHNLMQRYLNDLKENGYPEFITQYKQDEAPPPAATDPNAPGTPEGGRGEGGRGGGRPGGPPGGGRPGGPPGTDAQAPLPSTQQGGGGPPPLPSTQQGGGGGPPPLPSTQQGGGGAPGEGGPAGPGGAAQSGPPKPKKSITGNPTFLSVARELKKALNTLEDTTQEQQPVAVYVTKVRVDKVNIQDIPALLNKPEILAAVTLFSDLKVVGLGVTRLNEKKGSFSGYIEYSSSDAAKTSVEQHLIPGLTLLVAARMPVKLLPVTVRNADDATTNPGSPGGPFGPAGGGPPGGYGYGNQQQGPGGRPSGNGPGPGGSGMDPEPGPEASGPRGVSPPSGDENIQGPRGGMQPPRGGAPGGPPGGYGGSQQQQPGGGGQPGQGYPGGEGYPGTQPTQQQGANHIDVARDGAVVTLAGEFEWKEDVFATAVEPSFARRGMFVRGLMGMYSGEGGVFALAAKQPDGKTAGGVLGEVVKKDGQLPQGALPRDARNDDRRLPGSNQGLPYQPEQRVSFFAELIRFMDNKSVIQRKIDPNQAWYRSPNLDLAESWVPELLVPDYPQSAWRATSDLIADGRSVGATNFVGVAGLGLDAARLNPKDPEAAKKVGMTGYDWSSKPEDVTDGLSNTAYLIQVPPTYQRPWMAGGGATLMGVNDKGSDPSRPFMAKRPDGTRGTMVLMGDGSVRYVKEGIDPAVFRGMATRAGGEKVADFDKVVPPASQGGLGELKSSK